MPCNLRPRPSMTAEETKDSVIDILAKALRAKTASIKVIGGKLVIKGMSEYDKAGMADICIIRRMKLKGPYEIRVMLQQDPTITKLTT